MYSPEAQALDEIGEKWSLLIARDLLRGPLRFQELLAFVAGITPRMLSRRLKELEATGLVEQVMEPGHPPIARYTLTDAGRGLRPVVRSLAIWTLRHGGRRPRPGETVFAEQTWQTIAFYRDEAPGGSDGRPWTVTFESPEPVVWSIVRGEDGWEARPGPDADAGLQIATSRAAWEAIWRGALTWAVALAGGRVRAEGDAAEAIRFNAVFESLLARLSPAP